MSIHLRKSFRRAALAIAGMLMAACAFSSNAATTEYVHTDALGSVVAVTNSAGVLIEHREYEPYGRQLLPAALKDGPAYTGHVTDAATGLDYMQQRYYDPGIGRFLSVDPVTANSATGANFNRYKYAENNPYRFTDPDGRASCANKNCTTAYIDSMPAQARNQNPVPSTQPQNSSPVSRPNVLTPSSGPTITFKNDNPSGASPNQPVNLTTALAVESAVVKSGVDSVNVNSTTGGQHGARSNHYVGRAVDINRVNGQRVDSSAAAPAVSSVQSSAVQGIRENFGPTLNQKTYTPGGAASPVTTPSIVEAHRNHIHLSGQN